jgi:hypothetical protein
MNSTFQFVALAIAVPAAIAAIILAALRRLLPADLAQRYSAPSAFGVACITGYALIDGVTFPPERHWQWLPHLAWGASLISGVACSKTLRHFERLLLVSFFCTVAAWLIVPDWTSLKPSRTIWFAGLAPGLTLLAVLLEPLSSRIPAPTRFGSYAISAGGLALLAAAFLSITYGKLAMVPAAALVGCFFGSLVGKGGLLQGLGLPYAIVVGGWSFIATIDPPAPLWLLLVPAVAPLAMWCTAVGPAARLRGGTALLVRLGCVVAVLAACAAGLVATIGLP